MTRRALLLCAALCFCLWNCSASAAALQRTTAPKLDVPVWSLATLNADGSTNMNIVTYASSVSMKPPKWALSLYKGSLSHENFRQRGWGMLQQLTLRHAPCVALLGKQSGRDLDKMAELQRLGAGLGFSIGCFDVESTGTCGGEGGIPMGASVASVGGQRVSLFSDSPAILHLRGPGGEAGMGAGMGAGMVGAIDAGDHDVLVCNLLGVYMGPSAMSDTLDTNRVGSRGRSRGQSAEGDKSTLLTTSALRKTGII